MKTRLVALLLVACLVLAGCSANNSAKNTTPAQNSNNSTATTETAAPAGKVLKAKLGNVFGPDSPSNKASLKFAELVKEKTNGQIEIEVFPSSQLGNDREMMEQMRIGALDFNLCGVDIMAPFYDRYNVFMLPFLFKDSEEARKVFDTDLVKELSAQYEATNNVRSLALGDSSFRQLFTVNPASSLADVQPMKIRIPESDVYKQVWANLGINGTPLAFGELYTALQTKVIDGCELPLANWYASGLAEVTKHCYEINYMFTAVSFNVSTKFWNQLTEEQKAIVTECAREAAQVNGDLTQEAISTVKEAAKDVEFTTLDLQEWKDAVQTMYDNYAYPDDLAAIQAAIAG